jgi:phenylacetate-CoA ligase
MNLIPKIETATTREIQAFQNQKLKDQLQYLSEFSPFYKAIFKKNNIDIHIIKTVDDLINLPVTTKTDLQEHNDEFFCVPKSKIIDYVTTSGTLGKPVTFGLTEKDLERLTYNEAVSLACAGIKEGDIVQLMTTLDRRFMAGLAYFLGLRKMGAAAVRVGAGIPELQWDSILTYQPKYLIAVPSFLLKMIEYAEKNNIDYNASGVKGVVCIGETLRDQDFKSNLLTQKITDKWNIDLFSTYASTEMCTAFTECEAKQGGHLHPELIIVEILDDNNQPVKKGEMGELTVTTLGIEAMPLLRFKTGDIVKAHYEPCSCGRNTLRLGPVLGRKQQMIKYKGTTLYPPAMHDLMSYFEQIQLHQIEISTNDVGTDEIVIKIASPVTTDEFLDEIKDHFRAKLRVTPKIELIEFEVLEKMVLLSASRKPITFIDNRK